MVEFRRFFYFPLISQLTVHNEYYWHSQEVLRIKERHNFLEQTTHDIAELLKARRVKWISRISGAIAGFLVTHEILELVSLSGLPGTVPNLRIWLTETAHASPQAISVLNSLVEHWDMACLLAVLPERYSDTGWHGILIKKPKRDNRETAA
ncbi:hypothetical protein [Acidithiobacillus ferridurans]|uniref:hypothetical protein n=1 Tax=Acidithiobacillus ferridurans TaxID=1232575 RepID=UPI001C06C9F0|nr:hypothetical protein [Acidithiobacillus ferridurans]MBU2732458.1 hypothetical protein [Acidithiobacillus ferridurans]